MNPTARPGVVETVGGLSRADKCLKRDRHKTDRQPAFTHTCISQLKIKAYVDGVMCRHWRDATQTAERTSALSLRLVLRVQSTIIVIVRTAAWQERRASALIVYSRAV
jgi:hypothetical protein